MENPLVYRPLMEGCRAGHPAGCRSEGALAQLSCAPAFPCRSRSRQSLEVLVDHRYLTEGNWPARPRMSKPDYPQSNAILDARFWFAVKKSSLIFFNCCDSWILWYICWVECLVFDTHLYPFLPSSSTAVTKIPSLPPINKRKRWVVQLFSFTGIFKRFSLRTL